MTLCNLLLLVVTLSWSDSQGFVLPPSKAVATNNEYRSFQKQYSAKGETEEEEEERNRMKLVRDLQNSYYSSGSEEEVPQLDNDSGVMTNLPLWRVNWQELPGRSNVLNVHDPVYTNMFQIILNRPKQDCWYFGHLYMPDGSKNLRSNEYAFQLKNWQDEAADENRYKQRERTEVVGTLMRITDFRRLNDGRLCLLVQAMERFVVKDALQNLPYSIANVQIVPDYEELAEDLCEKKAAEERGNAVSRSFAYHAYEYDSIPLPIPEKDYMTAQDVYGAWVQDVLPFVPFVLNDSLLPQQQQQDGEASKASSNDGEQSLELRLLKNNILQTPAAHPEVFTSFVGKSSEELEDQLWNALAAFCKATGAVLPVELACLLPPNRSWDQDITIQRVSSDYPAQRRQRRLSYNAAALLESTPMGKDLRQIWLETPSTHARLASVLERFELLISALLFGEFE